MVEKLVRYTDPTSGETRMISQWAAALLGKQVLDKSAKLRIANKGKPGTPGNKGMKMTVEAKAKRALAFKRRKAAGLPLGRKRMIVYPRQCPECGFMARNENAFKHHKHKYGHFK